MYIFFFLSFYNSGSSNSQALLKKKRSIKRKQPNTSDNLNPERLRVSYRIRIINNLLNYSYA